MSLKTKTIQAKATILLVDGMTEAQYHEYKFGGMWLNQVRWKVVNFADMLTEEQAEGLVDKSVVYKNSINAFNWLLTGNDVLVSNPYNEPRSEDYDNSIKSIFESNYKLWQSAESKVFNPKTTLIFIKSN